VTKSSLLSRELAALGLDLADTLREEPRFLTDAAFIGALHLELRERLGAADARAALMQLGFLHGLRDALELVARGLRGAASGGAANAGRPRLAIALETAPATAGRPLRGAFRDGIEARALAKSLGPQSEAGCALSCGYASGWLSGVFDTDLVVAERRCAACGEGSCEFEARTPEDWAAEDAARAEALRLPFAPLRDLVGRHLAATIEAESAPASGRDPGARGVRVVVLDLGGSIVDESFGALDLERVLEAIEQLGAEPILTGISPLSERAVAGLEASHLIVQKDLPAAIAAAFQIADTMRRAL
jgi:anti-anti-sigma regulatory factor